MSFSRTQSVTAAGMAASVVLAAFLLAQSPLLQSGGSDAVLPAAGEFDRRRAGGDGGLERSVVVADRWEQIAISRRVAADAAPTHVADVAERYLRSPASLPPTLVADRAEQYLRGDG